MIKEDFCTRVYVLNIEDIDYVADYSNLYNMCTAVRKQRADRIKMEKDKIRCICAQLLLNAAYEDVSKDYTTKISKELPEMNITEKGKPYFEKSPLFFNVSHSMNRVVCAIAGSEVGCDVECKDDRGERIAKRFFTKEEYEYVTRNNDFRAIWTLKESVLKAAGIGLGFPMDEFSVVRDGNITDSIMLPYDGKKYYIKRYESDGVYDFSVCNCDGRFEDVIRQVVFDRNNMKIVCKKQVCK